MDFGSRLLKVVSAALVVSFALTNTLSYSSTALPSFSSDESNSLFHARTMPLANHLSEAQMRSELRINESTQLPSIKAQESPRREATRAKLRRGESKPIETSQHTNQSGSRSTPPVRVRTNRSELRSDENVALTEDFLKEQLRGSITIPELDRVVGGGIEGEYGASNIQIFANPHFPNPDTAEIRISFAVAQEILAMVDIDTFKDALQKTVMKSYMVSPSVDRKSGNITYIIKMEKWSLVNERARRNPVQIKFDKDDLRRDLLDGFGDERSELRSLWVAAGVSAAMTITAWFFFKWSDRGERRNRLHKEAHALGSETYSQFVSLLSFLKKAKNYNAILKVIDERLKGKGFQVFIQKMHGAFESFSPISDYFEDIRYFKGVQDVIDAVVKNPAGDFDIDVQHTVHADDADFYGDPYDDFEFIVEYRSELRSVQGALAKIIKLNSVDVLGRNNFNYQDLLRGVIVAQLDSTGATAGNGTHYLIRLINNNVLDLYVLQFLPSENQWVVAMPTYPWESDGSGFLLANPGPGGAQGGFGGSYVLKREFIDHQVQEEGTSLRNSTWRITDSKFKTALYQVQKMEEPTEESRRVVQVVSERRGVRSELRSIIENVVNVGFYGIAVLSVMYLSGVVARKLGEWIVPLLIRIGYEPDDAGKLKTEQKQKDEKLKRSELRSTSLLENGRLSTIPTLNDSASPSSKSELRSMEAVWVAGIAAAVAIYLLNEIGQFVSTRDAKRNDDELSEDTKKNLVILEQSLAYVVNPSVILDVLKMDLKPDQLDIALDKLIPALQKVNWNSNLGYAIFGINRVIEKILEGSVDFTIEIRKAQKISVKRGLDKGVIEVHVPPEEERFLEFVVMPRSELRNLNSDQINLIGNARESSPKVRADQYLPPTRAELRVNDPLSRMQSFAKGIGQMSIDRAVQEMKSRLPEWAGTDELASDLAALKDRALAPVIFYLSSKENIQAWLDSLDQKSSLFVSLRYKVGTGGYPLTAVEIGDQIWPGTGNPTLRQSRPRELQEEILKSLMKLTLDYFDRVKVSGGHSLFQFIIENSTNAGFVVQAREQTAEWRGDAVNFLYGMQSDHGDEQLLAVAITQKQSSSQIWFTGSKEVILRDLESYELNIGDAILMVYRTPSKLSFRSELRRDELFDGMIVLGFFSSVVLAFDNPTWGLAGFGAAFLLAARHYPPLNRRLLEFFERQYWKMQSIEDPSRLLETKLQFKYTTSIAELSQGDQLQRIERFARIYMRRFDRSEEGTSFSRYVLVGGDGLRESALILDPNHTHPFQLDINSKKRTISLLLQVGNGNELEAGFKVEPDQDENEGGSFVLNQYGRMHFVDIASARFSPSNSHEEVPYGVWEPEVDGQIENLDRVGIYLKKVDDSTRESEMGVYYLRTLIARLVAKHFVFGEQIIEGKVSDIKIGEQDGWWIFTFFDELTNRYQFIVGNRNVPGKNRALLQGHFKHLNDRSELRYLHSRRETRLYKSGIATPTTSLSVRTSNSTADNRPSIRSSLSGIGATTSAKRSILDSNLSTSVPTSRAVNSGLSISSTPDVNGTLTKNTGVVNINNNERNNGNSPYLDASKALGGGAVETLNHVIAQSIQIVNRNMQGDATETTHFDQRTILVLGPSVSTPDIIQIAAATGAHVVPLVETTVQATLINQHFASLGFSVNAATAADTGFLRNQLRKGVRVTGLGLIGDNEILNRLNRALDNQLEVQVANTLDGFGRFFGIENLSTRLHSELREAWFAAVAA